MGRIILIGGAPAVGKSYLAQQLSLKLGIPWISTDEIQTLMLGITRRHDSTPFIADPESHVVEKVSQFKTPLGESVEKQIRENEDTWKSVLAFIYKNDLWDSYIIEGIAVLPHFVDRDLKYNTKIKVLFLIEEHEERIAKALKMREVMGNSHTFLDNSKNIEIAWIMLFTTWLKNELTKFDFPCIFANEEGIPLNTVLDLMQ